VDDSGRRVVIVAEGSLPQLLRTNPANTIAVVDADLIDLDVFCPNTFHNLGPIPATDMTAPVENATKR